MINKKQQMPIIPKKLSFQLRFRNKTKTRKILNRNFRLQGLLRKFFYYSSHFCYSLTQKKEKQKSLLKNTLQNSSLENNKSVNIAIGKVFCNYKGLSPIKSLNYVSCTLHQHQYIYNMNEISNKQGCLKHALKPDYIFLKKKRVATKASTTASKLLFGCYGICFKQSGIIRSKFVETVKLDIAKNLKKKGRFWIRICCDTPYSAKPAETRMGKGKGSVSYWAAKVTPGQLFIEFSGVSLVQLNEIYQKLCKKSAITLKAVY